MKCLHKQTQKHFAVKIIQLENLGEVFETAEKGVNFINNEIDILRDLHHENIVKFEEYYKTGCSI